MRNISYSSRHRRKYGLHFLKSERVARRIVESGEISSEDTVLEIGPGKGILTRLMLESGAKVVAIEKDRELYEILRRRFESYINSGYLTLLNEDVLNVPLEQLQYNKIISNIPYSISSQLTLKLLKTKFKKGIIMYQKEFAERIVNVPPRIKYNRLATVVYFLATVRILFYVNPNLFDPPPSVYSAVVEITPKKAELPADFEEFTKILYSHPRKKIKNVIKNCLDFCEMRAEDLRPEEVMKLFYANMNTSLNTSKKIYI